MSKLANLQAKQKALKEEISSGAKDALGEAFTEFFAEHPAVTAIRWRQYTPYFNDGDACEFGVRDFEYREKEPSAEAAEEEEGEGDWNYPWSSDASPAAKAVSALGRLCDADVMLAAFGDHVQVIATRGGFDVTEHSHD